MGYTQFEKIPISKERLETMLQEQVDELVEQREHCEKFSIKQAELKKKSLMERLEALQNDKTDNTITFEELGVDRLYVDEAHYYKNLFTYSEMYTMQRYLQPDRLRDESLGFFDSWASNFGCDVKPLEKTVRQNARTSHSVD